MIFLKGLWHGVKVLSIGGYWLMTVYFLWAALILLGTSWQAALALLLMVVAVFTLRIVAGRRLKSPGAAYAGAFAVYMIVFIAMYAQTQRLG